MAALLVSGAQAAESMPPSERDTVEIPSYTLPGSFPAHEMGAAYEMQLAADVGRFVAGDAAVPPAPCQVLFVGSSSIANWTTLARDMAPLPVINRGFGGSHIEYVNRWFDRVVAPYRPRAIVLYAGENDLDAGKPTDRVIADFDAFMARKRAVLGETPVYFISLKPSTLRFAQFALQTQVNDTIRARAEAQDDLHYIDVVTPMLERGKPRDVFVGDQLHMSAEGYALWTQAVKASLLPHQAAHAQSCSEASATHRDVL